MRWSTNGRNESFHRARELDKESAHHRWEHVIAVLTVAMFASSSLALCCLAGARESSSRAWLASFVMVGGMILVTLPNMSLPLTAGSAVASAVLGALLLGRPRSRDNIHPMTKHRGYAALMMAALILFEVLMDVEALVAGPGAGGATTADPGHHPTHSGASPVMFLAVVSMVAITGFVTYSIRLVLVELNRPGRSLLSAGEITAMALSALSMFAMSSLMLFPH